MADNEQQQRAEGVSRQMTDQAAPREKEENSPEEPESARGAEGAGASTNRSGQDVKADDGKETGRTDYGTKGASDRPTGTSEGRDSTGVDAQDSTTGGPTLPTP